MQYLYQVKPRKDRRGVDLISDVLAFGRCTKMDDAAAYAKFFSRSHDAVIRVDDNASNLVETYEYRGKFCAF